MDRIDVFLYGFILCGLICVGCFIHSEMATEHAVVGQISDVTYTPQKFGVLVDYTEITFYGGTRLTVKGNQGFIFEAGKVYTIKYHLIFTGLPFFINDVISVKLGVDLS